MSPRKKETVPQIPLADRDPCEPVPDVLDRLHRTGTAAPQGPYACGVQTTEAGTGDPADSEIRISFEFGPDPRMDPQEGDLSPEDGALGTLSPARVGKVEGRSYESPNGTSCKYKMAPDTETTVKTDGETWMPIVAVTGPDCRTAKTATEAVLASLTK